MAEKTVIPFGQYAPDLGKTAGQSPMLKGVLPLSGRLAPLPGLQQIRAASAVNDICLGGRSFYDSSGFPVAFLADAGRIYKLDGKIPVNVSKSGGYAFSYDWGVVFEQFGDNIVAVGRGVNPQRFQLGSSSVYADLSGAPQGDTVFRIREHLFICSGSTVNVSGYNNITQWGTDAATQAFIGSVGQANGLIVAGWGGEQGAIFQERGIVRITYTGAAAPYNFDEIEGGRGVCGPNAWSPWGKIAFCVAEDGFYAFDGMSATPIGQNRVDREFASRLNYGYRHRVWAAIDAKRKCWMVGVPTEGAVTPNFVFIYSWADDRWTYDDDIESHFGFELHRDPVDADDEEGLIALFGTANADDPVFDNISVDSPIFRESRKEWAVLDGDRKLCQFTGPNRAATLSTASYEQTGRKTFVSELWPVTDAPYASVSGQVATRLRRLEETETVSTAAAMNEEGFCPVYAEGRYLRGIVNIAGGADWTEATGILSDGSLAGER